MRSIIDAPGLCFLQLVICLLIRKLLTRKLQHVHVMQLVTKKISWTFTLSLQGFPSRTNQSLLVTPAGSSNSPPGDAGVAPVGSGSVPVLPSQGVNLLPSFSGIVAAMDAGRDEGALNRRDSYDGLREAVRMEDNIPGM